MKCRSWYDFLFRGLCGNLAEGGLPLRVCKIPVEIIEIQNGEYLEEDDIERFDDHYGH